MISNVNVLIFSPLVSWNIGPVHIISFSTELYYFLEYGMEPLVRQYKWLQRDLEVPDSFCYPLQLIIKLFEGRYLY